MMTEFGCPGDLEGTQGMSNSLSRAWEVDRLGTQKTEKGATFTKI